MTDLIKLRRDTRKHDAWFRAEVQRAIDDPRPGIPHETVMDEAKATIDRIAAAKAKA